MDGEHNPIAAREFVSDMEARALGVIEEFVRDVDAAGVGRTAEDWPDLIVTYRHAKAVLAKIDPRAETGEGSGGQ